MSALLKECEEILRQHGFTQPKEKDHEGLPDGVKREQFWYLEENYSTKALFLELGQGEAFILLQKGHYSAPDRGDNHGSWYADRQNLFIGSADEFWHNVEKMLNLSPA